jgi:sugar-specific transcriptional regulator TrmB
MVYIVREEYITLLTKFKISPTAAKVYMTLLDLGKSSADQIAKKLSTYKSNVYGALDKLIEVGLASYIFEGKKKLYIPTNPAKLSVLADEEKQRTVKDYDNLKEGLNKILPQLILNYNNVKEIDVFEVYKGRKGFKALMQDILQEKPKYWKGFGNLQVQEYFEQDYQKWFKGIKFMLFGTKSAQVLKRLKETRKFNKVEMKWFTEDLYMPIVWTLFGGNLLIILYEPEIIVLRIKSEQIVKTFSNQFDYLWKKYKAELG